MQKLAVLTVATAATLFEEAADWHPATRLVGERARVTELALALYE